MVICQYFLKGTCKFGDRCFNEHRRSENRGSYNQGGRDSRNFGGGGRHGNNGGYDRNTGGGHYGKNTGYDDRHYDSYGNQGYRNQKNYQENRGGGRGGGRGSGRGGGRGGYRGSGYQEGGHREGGHQDGGYRDSGHRNGGGGYSGGYGGNQGDRNFGKDKYHYDVRDKNRFSALGHQPDPEPSSFEHRSDQPRGRSQSTASQQSVTQDQKVERVRKDMKEWADSGQWLLSCYAPFALEPCLDGFVDISPEEMRSEAYKANTGGNAVSYAQSLRQTMEKYKHRQQVLATMSSSALQDEISRSVQPSSAAVPGGLFGNLASSSQSLGETSLFGESMSTSSSGLFGSSSQSMPGPFGSNPTSNPSTTSSTLFGPSSSGPFGSTQVNNTPSSMSLFGRSQENPSKEMDSSSAQTTTDGTRPATMTSLRCSEEDLKAFRADHFILGAIPECPPPLELC